MAYAPMNALNYTYNMYASFLALDSTVYKLFLFRLFRSLW